MTTLIGISGSLRAASFNSALLRVAAAECPAEAVIRIESIEPPVPSRVQQISHYEGTTQQGIETAIEELLVRWRDMGLPGRR